MKVDQIEQYMLAISNLLLHPITNNELTDLQVPSIQLQIL